MSLRLNTQKLVVSHQFPPIGQGVPEHLVRQPVEYYGYQQAGRKPMTSPLGLV
jgi:hypothetical protein